MPKVELTDTTSGFGLPTVISTNNQVLEDALNNDVLYRNNPAGEANQMNNNLDMNGFSILNPGTDSSAGSLITRQDLADIATTVDQSPVLEDLANADIFVEDQGTDVTPIPSYSYGYIRFTAATPTSFIVPLNSTTNFIEGTEIHIRQAGTGQVTIAPVLGVTVNVPYQGTAILAGQGATVTIKYIGNDEWDLMGQVRAA